jgi:hypothetical protein
MASSLEFTTVFCRRQPSPKSCLHEKSGFRERKPIFRCKPLKTQRRPIRTGYSKRAKRMARKPNYHSKTGGRSHFSLSICYPEISGRGANPISSGVIFSEGLRRRRQKGWFAEIRPVVLTGLLGGRAKSCPLSLAAGRVVRYETGLRFPRPAFSCPPIEIL